MVFSSLTFICVFLPLVFLGSLALTRMKLKNALLIAASLLFYAYGEPVYVLLMLLSSILNYAFGRALGSMRDNAAAQAGYDDNGGRSSGRAVSRADAQGNGPGDGDPPTNRASDPPTRRASSPGRGRAVLVCAVIVNLGFLAVFKYAGMMVGTADTLFGLRLDIPVIALPIGISFYTFQAMSYVVDVYRGDTLASKSYAKVLLYISFFPQLIAGPIIKYHDVDAQLDSRRVTTQGVALGLRRFSVGLGKKVLIANTMGVVADSLFGAPTAQVNIAGAWLGAFAYVMQIYFDFSGYSDMAIGLARMFGFRYKENFLYPYVSSSIKEFWRRWHISLSTWFKEYLYIPLGGNRKGRARTGLNKVIVFFFCGLWHGASWTFVIWGLFHGAFLLLEEYLPIKKLPKAVGVVYALLVVTLGFVLFRSSSLDQAAYLIGQMFSGLHFDAASVRLVMQQLTPLFLVVAVVAVVACMPVRHWLLAALQKRDLGQGTRWHTLRRTLTAGSFVASLVLLVLCMLTLSSGGYNPFIYFRF